MKAKHTTKKALSVLLALLMLVMVFPAGVVTITAAGTDGDFELNDTDTTYTIDGPLDWNIVAGLSAAGETFEGKTIQLAADIDGNNLPNDVTLTTPLFKTFAGTFTGLKNASGATNADKYYTISNLSCTATGGTKGVIANEVSGTVCIKELNLNTVTIAASSGKNGVLVGNVQMSATLTVQNVYATACELSGGTGGGNALFVGYVTKANVSVIDCEASGSVASSGSATAGVIGHVYPLNNNTIALTNVNLHDLTIKSSGYGTAGAIAVFRANTETDIKTFTATLTNVDLTNVTVNNTGATYGVGGLLGGWTAVDASSITVDGTDVHNITVTGSTITNIGGLVGRATNAVGLTVKNVVLSGTNVVTGISNGDSADATDRGAGGLIGACQTSGSKNISINGVTVRGSLKVSQAHRSGMIIGDYTSARTLTVKNVTVEQGADVTIESKAANNVLGATVGSAAGVIVGEKSGTGKLEMTSLVLAGDVNVIASNTSGSYAGGVVGHNYNSGALEVATYTVGGSLNLQANNAAGGVLGGTGAVTQTTKWTTDPPTTKDVAASGAISVTDMTVMGTLSATATDQASAVNANDGSSGNTTVTNWKLTETGIVTLNAKMAGAIIGQTFSGGTLSVSDTTVAGTIEVTGTNVKDAMIGGLMGYSYGYGKAIFDGVALSGNITAKNVHNESYTGGLIGVTRLTNMQTANCTEVKQVSVTGKLSVDGKSAVGGVIGMIRSWTNNYQNCLIDGVVVAENAEVSVGSDTLNSGYLGVGGIVGTHRANREQESLTIRNIDIAKITLTGNTPKAAIGTKPSDMNRELMGVGGLIGTYVPFKDTELNVENVRLADGSATHTGVGENDAQYHKDGSVGGLIGYVTEYSGMYATSSVYAYDLYTGTINITNCETNLALNSTITSANQGTGGLIGSYGQRGANTANIPDMHATSTLNVTNCVIGGSINGANNSVAGAIGWVGFCGSTINLNHVIVDTDEIATTANAQVGLILGRALRSGITLTVANCSTTMTEAIPMAGDLGTQNGHQPTDDGYALTGCTIMVNGIAYFGGSETWAGGAFSVQNDVIAVITDAELAKMVTYGADGYIDSIRGHVVGGYEQHTDVGEDGTYSIRFIALVNQNDENVAEYGISLRMTDAEGTVTYYAVTCEAYETLEGFDREGLPAYEYDAMDNYGAKKFLAAVATGVPAEALTFDVIAWYTTHSGVTVYDTIRTAQYSAAAVLVNAL